MLVASLSPPLTASNGHRIDKRDMYVHSEEGMVKTSLFNFLSKVYVDVQYIKIDSRERISSPNHTREIAMISEINVNSSNAVDCTLGPNVNEIPT